MTDQITADRAIEQVDKYKQLSIGSKKAGQVLSKRHVQRGGRGKTRAVQLKLAVAVAVIIEMIVSVLAPVGTASATPPQPHRRLCGAARRREDRRHPPKPRRLRRADSRRLHRKGSRELIVRRSRLRVPEGWQPKRPHGRPGAALGGRIARPARNAADPRIG